MLKIMEAQMRSTDIYLRFLLLKFDGYSVEEFLSCINEDDTYLKKDFQGVLNIDFNTLEDLRKIKTIDQLISKLYFEDNDILLS
jgi:hypothetical protein